MTAHLRLLIDTDAFCKLAAAGLLDDVLAFFGVTRAECARLPALSPMLQRGHLRNRYGEAESDRLRAIAQTFSKMPEPSTEWLDTFSAVPAIDPGEAQIYALAAERGLMVLTGDKRALKALGSLTAAHPRLNGNIVTLEAALLGLVGRLTDPVLRAHGKILAEYDQMAKAVFSSAGSSLDEALKSYVRHIEIQVQPLTLWRTTC